MIAEIWPTHGQNLDLVYQTPRTDRVYRTQVLARDAATERIELSKSLDEIPIEDAYSVRIDDQLLRQIFQIPMPHKDSTNAIGASFEE
jgi:hypothetical protein